MTTFSDRLKEAMYAQNLKQIDLVHIAAENNVKLGKSHVSQYVSGKTVPRNDILHFLADTLHVDADWLLGDSQENFTARENNSVAPKAPSTTKTSGSVGTSNSSKRGTTPIRQTRERTTCARSVTRWGATESSTLPTRSIRRSAWRRRRSW